MGKKLCEGKGKPKLIPKSEERRGLKKEVPSVPDRGAVPKSPEEWNPRGHL